MQHVDELDMLRTCFEQLRARRDRPGEVHETLETPGRTSSPDGLHSVRPPAGIAERLAQLRAGETPDGLTPDYADALRDALPGVAMMVFAASR